MASHDSTAATALAAAEETTRRFKEAAEAGDVEDVLATLAPDVVLNSPITSSGHFTGLDDMRGLMTAVFDTLSDIRYFEDFGDATTRLIANRAHIGNQQIEEALLIRLDDQARIRELTVFVRPLPGLTAMLAGLGPKLARRRGRTRAAALTALAKPLALLTRSGDKPGTRLAGLRKP
jgi:SnoaL-like domain